MRKIFLFVAALAMTMTAKAFELTVQNSNLSKNESITANLNDVFGDGKVSAEFESDNKRIILTAENGAVFKSTNGQEAIRFIGDENYKILSLNLKGTCEITAENSWGVVLTNASMQITATSPDAVLNINAKLMAFNMKQESALYLGDAIEGDVFTINMTSAGTQPFFYGGGGSYSQSLGIFFANVNINNPNGNSITSGLNLLMAPVSKLSNGVEIKDKMFKKDDAEYKGNLTITAPYRIAVGTDYLYPGDEDDFKPTSLKNGKISYNKATKTMTLEGVTIDDYILVDISGFTLYLKGDNRINKGGISTVPRIDISGANAKITGDADAELTIHAGGQSEAIYATDGLEISGFKLLTTYAANDAIKGYAYPSANNVLKIGVAMTLNCADNHYPVVSFDEVTVIDPDLELTYYCRDYVYSTIEKKYVDKNDESNLATYIAYDYPVYMELCGYGVNAKNMADIKIPNAEGKASYDRTNSKLTLNGFKQTTGDPMNAISANSGNLTIVLAGENEISSSTDGIDSYGNDIIIEGSGKLKLSSQFGSGISMAENKKLTLRKGATVEAIGYNGLVCTGTLMCMPGGIDPMDYELSGDAAYLEINNATLIAKSTQLETYYAAIQGFHIPTLTDAVLSAPANASFMYGCNSMDAIAGVVVEGVYAHEATITKTGATALENTMIQNEKGQKTIIDGKLYILCGEHMYDAQGKMVR